MSNCYDNTSELASKNLKNKKMSITKTDRPALILIDIQKGLGGQNYSAELIHETALASLNDEFATVVTINFLKQNIK